MLESESPCSDFGIIQFCFVFSKGVYQICRGGHHFISVDKCQKCGTFLSSIVEISSVDHFFKRIVFKMKVRVSLCLLASLNWECDDTYLLYGIKYTQEYNITIPLN